MADIQNQQKYGDLYNHLYPYQKNFYNIATIPSTHTYRGTVEIPAGLTQKGTGTYPLVHAKDVQIGNIESDRLNDKLADYDIILRELYGRAPSQLEQLSDGRSSQEINNLNTEEGRSIANDNLRVANNDGLESLDKIATVLNNRTETIDDRLLDLRMFKTVELTTVKGSNTSNLVNGAAATIVADNNSDTLTIKSENEWIILKGNAVDDSFTIGHYKKDFSATTDSVDLNTDSTDTIVLQTLAYDKAGHITAEENTTYTLPQNFKTISVLNANVNSTNGITTDNNSIIANNSFADMKFIAGNKWIQFATDNTKREITIAHALSVLDPGAHNSAYTLEAQTPKFGDNFNILIPTISFTTDAAGHVTACSYSSSNTTVTLPTPNITSSSTYQVVTSIDKDITEGHNNGTFTYSKANIGTLAITGYTLGSNNNALAETDTLNIALGKLQVQINSINSWRINGAAITNSTLLNAATLKMSNEANAETIESAIAAASTAHTTAGYLTDFSTLTAQDIVNKLIADGVNLWSLKQALDAATDPNANPGEGE